MTEDIESEVEIQPATAREPPTGDVDLRARLLTDEDGRTACTIYQEADESTVQRTAWITAEEGAYFPLAEMR